MAAARECGSVFLLGLAAALVASALFNVGVALQGLEARETPRSSGLQVSLLGRLLRRPRWVLGLLLGLVGIGPQALAYARAPFVVVQTALAAGLLLLLFLAVRAFGEHVGPLEIGGVAAIIVGVALVSWGAPPHSAVHRSGLDVVAVVAGLALAALFPFLVRGTRLDSGMGVVIAAGCGFGAANVATKLMSDDIGTRDWLAAGGWAAAGLGIGIAATITSMTAFQRREAKTVVPVVTAIQIFLPVILEPLFLREYWSAAAYAGVPILLGLLFALVGSVLVSRSAGVSELTAGAQRG